MSVDMMTLTSIIWLIVTVAAVAAGGWLVFSLARADRVARRVLDERLARGEIDIEDYRARIALLGGQARG